MATVPPTSSTSVLDRFAGFVKSINPFTSTTPVTTPAAPAAAPTAPVAPVIAPIQQPAPAAVQKPVDVALKTLTTSDLQKDLDKLWKEKVTDASTLGKIIGVFSYIFSLPSVYAKSLTARATIEELNSSVAELARAVHQRALTAAEQQLANAPGIQVSSIEQQIGQAGANLAAEAALTKFYEVFAKRTAQLNVSKDSEAFGIFSQAAQKMIRNAGEVGRKALVAHNTTQTRSEAQVLPVKIETTVANFTQVAVTAMMDELAGKETLDKITPDGYKSTVSAIARVAPGQSLANIEADLRKKIKANHGAAMLPLITEFRNVDPASERNQAIRNGIKGALEADKTAEEASLAAINTELAPLTGDNGWNGSVDAAYRAKETALAEYNAAEAAYMRLRFVGAPANVTRRALLDLPLNPSAELSAAHADAVAKLRTLEAAEAAFDALNQRCQTLLAQRGTVEGKLGQIGRDLSDAQLDIAARNTREKSLRFYVELNESVSRRNIAERYNAMRVIIGN